MPPWRDLVVRGRRVVRQRQVDELVVLARRRTSSAKTFVDVVGVPGERDLAAMRLAGDLLERFAADEVVVELDERAVADLVRRHVVVLDVVRDEAAADRAGGLVARSPAATRGTSSSSRRCRRRAAARESSPTRACWSRRRASRPASARTPCRPRRSRRGSPRAPRTGPRSRGPARRPCRGAACAPCGRRS